MDTDPSPPTISVYTFTLGRTHYLNKLLKSVIQACVTYSGKVELHLCCQGVDLDPVTIALARECGVENLAIEIDRWPENIGTPRGVNRIVPKLRGDLIIKMDEDCLIHSDGFFEHVAAVSRLKPNATFSPYPVGLIGFAGGSKALDHHVDYAPETDTYYTFRRVEHVGGFCRVSHRAVVGDWKLIPPKSIDVRNEDRQYSKLAREQGIEMYYLENALVVEHQESTLGQRARFEEYFGERPRGTPRPWFRRLLSAAKRSLQSIVPGRS